AEHAGLIAGEVLAADFGLWTADQVATARRAAAAGLGAEGQEAAGGGAVEHVDDDLGLTFWLRRV
ncbi:MAG: hypothetical protein ACRDOU_20705, partial [Streptosporangiaceae bacterium]